MRRPDVRACLIGAVCFAIVAAGGSTSAVAASQDDAVLAADSALLAALGKKDKSAADKLLDQDFTWVDANAKERTRAQVLDSLPTAANSDVQPKVRLYGTAAVVKADQGKAYVMRIWVKRRAGWRALLYQEVTLESMPPIPPAPPGTSTECDNPCKNYPYQAKTKTEKEILASLHGVITGLVYHDPDSYGANTADEFEATVSQFKKVFTRSERLVLIQQQQKAGAPPAIMAPVTSARMFDFGEAVVLKQYQTTRNGKHDVNTRMWTRRSGRWLLLFSFETIGGEAL
jgi:hypothetical protein